MTTFTSKEEMSSTIMESTNVSYIKASLDPKDSVPLVNTIGSMPSVRSVSTSIITGEVKLRLAPREMPNRKLNISSR